MRGLRPNSPIATTSVSFNRPRWSMSSSSADRPRSSFGQCRFFSGPKFAACVSQALGLRIAVGHRRPVHLHERRARLDQPARHQQALPEGVQAVALAHLVGSFARSMASRALPESTRS